MSKFTFNQERPGLLPIILLLAILLAPACKKDDPIINPPTSPTTFTAKIDGGPFGEFNFANVYYREKSLLVEIFAKQNGEYFSLYIVGFTGVGIYPLERENIAIQQNLLTYHIGINSEEKVYSNTLNTGGAGFVQVNNFDPNGFITLSFSCTLKSVADTGAVVISDVLLTNGEVTNVWPLEAPPSHLLAVSDGVEFVAYPEPQFPGTTMQINAYDGGSRAIRLVVPEGIAPGSYDLANPSFQGSGYSAGADFFPLVSGTLQISGSSFNTNPVWIRGTFQFASEGGHIVTNGDFYVED